MIIDHGQYMQYLAPMSGDPRDRISISRFKATCLAELERVRRTGRPLLVTKRGEPIAEIVPPTGGESAGSWLGAMRGTATFADDLIASAATPEEWDAERA
jgi:prevent-host-death family protein